MDHTVLIFVSNKFIQPVVVWLLVFFEKSDFFLVMSQFCQISAIDLVSTIIIADRNNSESYENKIEFEIN